MNRYLIWIKMVHKLKIFPIYVSSDLIFNKYLNLFLRFWRKSLLLPFPRFSVKNWLLLHQKMNFCIKACLKGMWKLGFTDYINIIPCELNEHPGIDVFQGKNHNFYFLCLKEAKTNFSTEEISSIFERSF